MVETRDKFITVSFSLFTLHARLTKVSVFLGSCTKVSFVSNLDECNRICDAGRVEYGLEYPTLVVIYFEVSLLIYFQMWELQVQRSLRMLLDYANLFFELVLIRLRLNSQRIKSFLACDSSAPYGGWSGEFEISTFNGPFNADAGPVNDYLER